MYIYIFPRSNPFGYSFYISKWCKVVNTFSLQRELIEQSRNVSRSFALKDLKGQRSTISLFLCYTLHGEHSIFMKLPLDYLSDHFKVISLNYFVQEENYCYILIFLSIITREEKEILFWKKSVELENGDSIRVKLERTRVDSVSHG